VSLGTQRRNVEESDTPRSGSSPSWKKVGALARMCSSSVRKWHDVLHRFGDVGRHGVVGHPITDAPERAAALAWAADVPLIGDDARGEAAWDIRRGREGGGEDDHAVDVLDRRVVAGADHAGEEVDVPPSLEEAHEAVAATLLHGEEEVAAVARV